MLTKASRAVSRIGPCLTTIRFAVIEGLTIAAYATGATRGFIYLRYEYPQTLSRFWSRHLAEARGAGLLGDDILGAGFDFEIYVRRGAGAYICGEETSLLNSLEGKHPFPRNRPPYPVTNGFEDLPTAVNNVETLASVPQIVRKGAAWYQDSAWANCRHQVDQPLRRHPATGQLRSAVWSAAQNVCSSSGPVVRRMDARSRL
jgi:NADH:ubiquinone oxidoreductase subunit F (NADH-binding)